MNKSELVALKQQAEDEKTAKVLADKERAALVVRQALELRASNLAAAAEALEQAKILRENLMLKKMAVEAAKHEEARIKAQDVRLRIEDKRKSLLDEKERLRVVDARMREVKRDMMEAKAEKARVANAERCANNMETKKRREALAQQAAQEKEIQNERDKLQFERSILQRETALLAKETILAEQAAADAVRAQERAAISAAAKSARDAMAKMATAAALVRLQDHAAHKLQLQEEVLKVASARRQQLREDDKQNAAEKARVAAADVARKKAIDESLTAKSFQINQRRSEALMAASTAQVLELGARQHANKMAKQERLLQVLY